MTEKTFRRPINIAVFPYMQDHRFEGKAVFPAVEAMQILEQAVKDFAPETDTTAVTEARFDKFLLIPPDSKKIEAFCNLTPLENGDIIAVLQTKTRAKTAGFTRIKEHVSVHFPRTKPELTAKPNIPSTFGNSDCLEISPDQIYQELVPFGPAYQNISENLAIHRNGGLAKLRAPIIKESVEKNTQLGSPFVLDAAFHAACVWGQRYSGVVAFPVRVETRIIVKPTQPGETYIGRILPVRTDSDRLVFDIFICGEDNVLFEKAVGVQMRDVSAGRIKPPLWIRAIKKGAPC